ncbi:uncharacterized protein LOC128229184 [Mya arenaria]|uniref:uncharacterized protein LOC128229184 n=1 Tax=Mya arenaria TaxID=6604 RepID=UPI0022E85298|nr:uncharacterized protein LOC128229184 [Mya arenaria]
MFKYFISVVLLLGCAGGDKEACVYFRSEQVGNTYTSVKYTSICDHGCCATDADPRKCCDGKWSPWMTAAFVLAGVLIVGAIVLAVLLILKKKKKKREQVNVAMCGEQGDLFQMYEGMRKPPDYNQLFSQRPTSASRAHDHTNETETKLPPDDLSVDLNDAREMQSVPPPSFHASRGYPERAPTTVIVAQSPVREG